ncbi:MAG: glycerophosphodiester phosphodiesterase family protein [Devosia sp.]
MNDPVSVTRNGHRTFLKWHRGRRYATDPVFTGRRILEGMALGASVEVDLVVHGGNGFAVLHDHETIARETTGSGAARDLNAAQMRALNLRGNDGAPVDDHVMLLEDLCALLRDSPPNPAAVLQLDFKEYQGALAGPTILAFAMAVAPVARNMILSSGDARAVHALASATPGLRTGHDPCHDGALERLSQTHDFAGFVATALADAPTAEMIYLAYQLVLAAADEGFDIVAAFHAAGRRIDAYTIKTADAVTLPIVHRLLALKVDQITTDDPEGLAALLEAE